MSKKLREFPMVLLEGSDRGMPLNANGGSLFILSWILSCTKATLECTCVYSCFCALVYEKGRMRAIIPVVASQLVKQKVAFLD